MASPPPNKSPRFYFVNSTVCDEGGGKAVWKVVSPRLCCVVLCKVGRIGPGRFQTLNSRVEKSPLCLFPLSPSPSFLKAHKMVTS